MSATWVLYIIGLAVLVLIFFAFLWWFDARRAKEVENDPERIEPEPDSHRADDR